MTTWNKEHQRAWEQMNNAFLFLVREKVISPNLHREILDKVQDEINKECLKYEKSPCRTR